MKIKKRMHQEDPESIPYPTYSVYLDDGTFVGSVEKDQNSSKWFATHHGIIRTQRTLYSKKEALNWLGVKE